MLSRVQLGVHKKVTVLQTSYLSVFATHSNLRVVIPSGEKIYLFDVANTIKKNPAISDAVVLNITEQNDTTKLYAHLEWANGLNKAEKITALNEIDKAVKQLLPYGMEIAGYAEHDRIPYSPTTLKKDKNRLAKQTDGYFRVENNKRVEVC